MCFKHVPELYVFESGREGGEEAGQEDQVIPSSFGLCIRDAFVLFPSFEGHLSGAVWVFIMAVDLNQDDNCLIPQSIDLQEIRRRSLSSWTHAGLQLLSHLNPPNKCMVLQGAVESHSLGWHSAWDSGCKEPRSLAYHLFIKKAFLRNMIVFFALWGLFHCAIEGPSSPYHCVTGKHNDCGHFVPIPSSQ